MPDRYELGDAVLYAGDCREILPTLGNVDAIVTDPPYHLIQGSRNGSLRQNDPAKPFGRAEARGGFMGQRWDGGDIAFRPETWAAMLPALKPGGYLLAFGGTRTHHRIWCAIDDAGFVIQDTIMWITGQGFPKGRTQLKPAFEPIVVAYKPGGKRTLQVDECRIGFADSSDECEAKEKNAHADFGDGPRKNRRVYGDIAAPRENYNPPGRWPANVVHDGSDEAMAAFAAFPTHSAGHARAEPGAGSFKSENGWGGIGAGNKGFRVGDSGTPARFFYAAKASKVDRAGSQHPTVKPLALMRWLVRLVTPPGGTVLDPFAGSGTTGAAALAEGRRAILIEREPEYIADIRRRLGDGTNQLPSPRKRSSKSPEVRDLFTSLD